MCQIPGLSEDFAVDLHHRVRPEDRGRGHSRDRAGAGLRLGRGEARHQCARILGGHRSLVHVGVDQLEREAELTQQHPALWRA